MKIDRLIAGTAISWIGLWIHELYRVPRLLGFTPDGDLFMLVIAAGLAYWWYRTRSFGAAWALLAYALVNLVGGALSVLPLDWLPFKPEQTAIHYSVHVIYAVCQLPLIFFSASVIVRRTPAQAS
jgi:hypothetical protein